RVLATRRRPPRSTLFPYTTLFRSTSPEALTGVEVVVADGKITGIVPTGTNQAAPEEIVDLGDRTLMPGLIDLHVHFARTLSEERSEEHTSELQSRENLVCRLLLEK